MPNRHANSSYAPTTTKLFGRERPLHAVLGGRTVADVLLWRNKNLSAGCLIGFTVLWFLLEIVEYRFLPLLCHICIIMILVLFIWSNGAPLFNRWWVMGFFSPKVKEDFLDHVHGCQGFHFVTVFSLFRDPPRLPKIILSESALHQAARAFHKKLNRLWLILYDIACGKKLSLFIVVTASLWILSAIGTFISTPTLLYFGFLCLITLPALYERYEYEVDYLARKSKEDIKKLYKKFDSKVLNKIPRGPVKEKKFK